MDSMAPIARMGYTLHCKLKIANASHYLHNIHRFLNEKLIFVRAWITGCLMNQQSVVEYVELVIYSLACVINVKEGQKTINFKETTCTTTTHAQFVI